MKTSSSSKMKTIYQQARLLKRYPEQVHNRGLLEKRLADTHLPEAHLPAMAAEDHPEAVDHPVAENRRWTAQSGSSRIGTTRPYRATSTKAGQSHNYKIG